MAISEEIDMSRLFRSAEMVALVCIALSAPLVVMAMSPKFHSGRDLLLTAALLFDAAGLVLGINHVVSTRTDEPHQS